MAVRELLPLLTEDPLPLLLSRLLCLPLSRLDQDIRSLDGPRPALLRVLPILPDPRIRSPMVRLRSMPYGRPMSLRWPLRPFLIPPV